MNKKILTLLIFPITCTFGCASTISEKKARELIAEIDGHNFNFATTEKFSVSFKQHSFMSGKYYGENEYEKEDVEGLLEYSTKSSFIHIKYTEIDEERTGNAIEIEKETEEEWIYVSGSSVVRAESEVEEYDLKVETSKTYKILNNDEQGAKKYFTDTLQCLITEISSVMNTSLYITTVKSILDNETEPGLAYEKTKYKSSGRGSLIVNTNIKYTNYAVNKDYGNGDGTLSVAWDNYVISSIETTSSLHVINYINNTDYNAKASGSVKVGFDCSPVFPNLSEFEYSGVLS